MVVGGFGSFWLVPCFSNLQRLLIIVPNVIVIKLAVILKKENLYFKTPASINKGTVCCLKSGK